MRKIAIVFLASVALFSAACGGGSDKKASVNAGANVGANVNSAAINAAAAKVCGGREAVAFSATAASAIANSGGKDFKSLSQGLHDAAAAAPSEIKADFTLFADAEGAFLDLMVNSNGNYMQLAQNPDFQAKAQRLSQPDVKAAAEHINSYFAEHCKG